MSSSYILGTVAVALILAGLMLGVVSMSQETGPMAEESTMDPWAPALGAAGVVMFVAAWIGQDVPAKR